MYICFKYTDVSLGSVQGLIKSLAREGGSDNNAGRAAAGAELFASLIALFSQMHIIITPWIYLESELGIQ